MTPPAAEVGAPAAPELGGFWRCLTGTDVDAERLANGQQIRRLVESAFDREGEKLPARIEATCLPMLAGVAGVAELESATRAYAARMRTWKRESGEAEEEGDGDEAEHGIVASARAWEAGRDARAYERFLACVVPDLDAVPDGQALYERLSNACFRGDLLAFVERARGACARSLDEPSPARAASVRRKRLLDPERRHARLWAQCLELAEEQRRLRDGLPLASVADRALAARRPVD